jgi:lipopolysaccharide cholinephosphotransferase
MSKEFIDTVHGVYSYHPKKLFTGFKKINTGVAFRLLTDVVEILSNHSIDHCLMFGTLLGAIREGGLIAHDEDVDIFIRESDSIKLINVLFKMRELEINVVRYDGSILSVMRDGEYIDFYIFSNINNNRLRCQQYIYDKYYFNEFVEMKMKGYIFNVPKYSELLLGVIYGEDWRIPKVGKHAMANSFRSKAYRKIVRIMKNTLPVSIFLFLKNLVKAIQ